MGGEEGWGKKKAAAGYSFLNKSIISKGCNFHTSGAVKLFTVQRINIFSRFLTENSFYHRITFHFKVSSTTIQYDVNAEALNKQYRKSES